MQRNGTLRRVAIASILSLVVGCAHKQPAKQPFYPISYWCGPEPSFTSIERYQQIKDAGFTFVMPPCHGVTVEENQQILDICQKLNLKAIVMDPRIGAALQKDDHTAGLDDVVKDYASHPALMGYFIVDEPVASQFPAIAAVSDYLRKQDGKHITFTNLFPNVVNPKSLKAKDYTDYVHQFATTGNPSQISYDHYSLQDKGDDKLFIANLAAVRRVALDTNLPFWNIIQVTQWSHMRNLTAAEIEFQAMQSLAMGAKGIIWFTYWTPVNDKSQPWSNAMIDPDGNTTAHYAMVRDTNRRVLAFGNELMGATSTGYFQTGKIPSGGKAAPTGSPVQITSGDVEPLLTVGLFHAKDGKKLVMLANSDYKNNGLFTATFSADNVERFDVETSTWQPASHQTHLALKPAAAALYRLTPVK